MVLKIRDPGRCTCQVAFLLLSFLLRVQTSRLSRDRSPLNWKMERGLIQGDCTHLLTQTERSLGPFISFLGSGGRAADSLVNQPYWQAVASGLYWQWQIPNKCLS